MDNTSNQSATRQDLHDLKKEIVDELSAVIGDVLTAVGFGFQALETRLENRMDSLEQRIDVLQADVQDLKAGQNRIENKLDATSEQVQAHAVHIAKLEARTA